MSPAGTSGRRRKGPRSKSNGLETRVAAQHGNQHWSGHRELTTAAQMLAVVREVKSDWFGVNLDTGNFRSADPYGELAQLAPYAVVVQVKSEMSSGGTRHDADFARIIKILRGVNYRGFVTLEYEADEEPRAAVPRHLRTLRKLIA